jgi:hypothetical protein
MLRNTVVFLSWYLLMSDPPGQRDVWFGTIFGLMFASWGIGYLLSIMFDLTSSLPLSVTIAVAWSVTSGLSPRLDQIDDYGPLQIFWWISYNRWAAEAIMVNVASEWDYIRLKTAVSTVGYKLDSFPLDFSMMILIGIAYRILAFIALMRLARKKGLK